MSDPLRDAAAKKRAEKRETIREEYTPIVTWVKVPEGKRVQDVRKWMEEEADSLPYTSVATRSPPYRYATDGVLRPEDVDGVTDSDQGVSISKEARGVLKTIEEKGPIGHEPLAERVDMDLFDLQGVIRVLREEDLISNTLDRRYEVNE